MENCVAKHVKEVMLLKRRNANRRFRLCLVDALVVVRRYMAILSDPRQKTRWGFDGFHNTTLIMSFLIATGARCGDLGIPHNTNQLDQALQLCEIDLRLNPGELSLENVVLTINLTCYKGNEQVSSFFFLSYTSANIVCF